MAKGVVMPRLGLLQIKQFLNIFEPSPFKVVSMCCEGARVAAGRAPSRPGPSCFSWCKAVEKGLVT